MSPRRPEPRIETARLVLRQPEPREAPAVLAYYLRNREHHAPWDPPRPAAFYTQAHWEEQLARNQRDAAADRSLRTFLFAREGDPAQVLGALNLSNFVRGPFQNAQIGYSLDAAAVGRGLMSEALEAAVQHAWGPLRLHRLEANYVPHNLRSAAVLERCGFAVQGYARRYLFIAGAWRDHVLTARLNPDPAPPPGSEEHASPPPRRSPGRGV